MSRENQKKQEFSFNTNRSKRAYISISPSAKLVTADMYHIITGILTGGNDMQKSSGEFSMQDAMRFAKSPVGEQLLSMIQKKNPEALNQAMTQANEGNYDQIKDTMSALLKDKDIQKMLKQFGG